MRFRVDLIDDKDLIGLTVSIITGKDLIGFYVGPIEN